MRKNRFKTRGFVKECEEHTLELRDEMGLGPFDPLDPLKLAAMLEVPVATFSELGGAGAMHFAGDAGRRFSALLVPFDVTRKGIAYNDRHAEQRMKSSVCHELGHLCLGHECVQPFDDDRSRNVNSEYENQATEFAGFLLVPRTAALQIERSGESKLLAAQRLGISEEFLDFRLRVTVRVQVARERRRRLIRR